MLRSPHLHDVMHVFLLDGEARWAVARYLVGGGIGSCEGVEKFALRCMYFRPLVPQRVPSVDIQLRRPPQDIPYADCKEPPGLSVHS